MPRAPRGVKSTRGVPPKPIDWDRVEKLIKCGCNAEQIAANLGISADTLTDRVWTEKGVYYTEYKTQMRAIGDSMIHEKQFDVSMKGNTQMLLRLGEERLGQGKKYAETDPSHLRADIILQQEIRKAVAAALLKHGIVEPEMEAEQPILDQGQGREENTLQDELGSEGTV